MSADHNGDLSPADGEVLVTVDTLPLEGQSLPSAGLHQEDNSEASLS